MSRDWTPISLGKVLRQSQETIVIEPDETYQQITVRMWGNGVTRRGEVAGSELGSSTWFVAKAGQFILSRIDARNGAFGIVPHELNDAIVSNDFPLFNVDETLLNPQFLYWLSKTESFVHLCKVASEGTTNRVRLKLDKFLATEILRPPLDEQCRIVAQIEALAAQIAEARGLRAEAAGKAEALINSVSSTCFTELEQTNSVKLSKVAEVRGGIQKSSNRIPDSNPRRYLTVAHVQRNWIDMSNPRYFEVSDDELQRWRLLDGDVLVVEGNGSADQIGRAALFRGEIEDCVHQNHIIRVRPNKSQVLPEFLNLYLNSPAGRQQMQNVSRTSSGLFHLSVGKIQDLDIPFSSLEVQAKVVAYIDSLQSYADSLHHLHIETSNEFDALLPAILDRAFRGEL